MSDYELLLAAGRNDFMAMNEICFGVLNPNRPFIDNWHQHVFAKTLEDAERGVNPRFVIATPPRSMKSLTTSIAWPANLLGRNPGKRIMVVSYSERLGQDLHNKTRRFMESAIYRDLFPGTRITRSSSELIETDQGGCRLMTWVGGPTTGFGADWILFDDPHNALEAYSPAARERVKTYFDLSLSQRFDDETDAKIGIIMQRLHDDDVAGHVLRRPEWHHVKLQAQATEDTLFDLGNGRTHLFKRGDLMDPRRLPQDVLDRKKVDMGSIGYQAQYLQQPVPEEGNMIDKAWLRYDDPPPDRTGSTVVLSLDTATKIDPANDFSACTVWLCTPSKHYLLDTWRAKVNFPTLRQKMLDLMAVHKANTILIEDQGTGSALIQELTNLGLPAVPRRSNVPKAARLAGISSYIEAGLMVLPKDDPHWLAEFVSEFLSFPAGQYDDQVDTVSQYFEWVRVRPKPDFFHADFGWGEPATPDMDALAERIMWRNRSFGPGTRFTAP